MKVGEDREELRRVDRLGDMRLVPGRERPRAILRTRIRRQRDGGNDAAPARLERAHFANQHVPVLERQADVAHEHVGRTFADRVQGVSRRRDRRDLDSRGTKGDREGFAPVRVVLDEEDTEAGQRPSTIGSLPIRRLFPRGGCPLQRHPTVDGLQGGKPHDEGRTLALSIALGMDVSTMQLDERPHDRQAEADAAVGPRARGVRLAETVEDVGEERRT